MVNNIFYLTCHLRLALLINANYSKFSTKASKKGAKFCLGAAEHHSARNTRSFGASYDTTLAQGVVDNLVECKDFCWSVRNCQQKRTLMLCKEGHVWLMWEVSC